MLVEERLLKARLESTKASSSQNLTFCAGGNKRSLVLGKIHFRPDNIQKCHNILSFEDDNKFF